MGGFSEILWFEQSALPLLAILQLLPLLGAAVVFAFDERSTAVLAGKVFALAELLLCLRSMAGRQGACGHTALLRVVRQQKWLGGRRN